jgi:hypothetical protein
MWWAEWRATYCDLKFKPICEKRSVKFSVLLYVFSALFTLILYLVWYKYTMKSLYKGNLREWTK